MAAAGDNPLAIESATMRRMAHEVVELLIARLSDPERDPVLRSATRDETEQRLGEPPLSLLKQVPTTATVVAQTDVELLSLDPDIFIDAITGNSQARQVVDDVMTQRVEP
jgi:hypothetical protein